MNVLVVQFLNIKLLAASPDVSVLIEIALEATIDGSHKTIAPEVKLPVVDEKWMIYVLLDNESLVLGLSVLATKT